MSQHSLNKKNTSISAQIIVLYQVVGFNHNRWVFYTPNPASLLLDIRCSQKRSNLHTENGNQKTPYIIISFYILYPCESESHDFNRNKAVRRR
jgi:hypothetical protein